MEQTATNPTEAEAFDPAGRRVLIVDDNPQNVELLQAYLDSLDVVTETVTDGLAAVQRMEDTSQPEPDLVLLDVMMPRMSGFEVCAKLKSDPRTTAIPVMMVTALNELGDIERAVQAGTDEFVTKPVHKVEFVTRVKSLLKSRHHQQVNEEKDSVIRELEAMLRERQGGA